MNDVISVLNAVKDHNDVIRLRQQLDENSKKSKRYLESCKEIVIQGERKHSEEIEKMQKKIDELSVQINEQKATIELLENKIEEDRRILDHIPRWIRSFIRKEDL